MLIPRPTTKIPELPTPSGFRQVMPAVLEPPVESERIQRAEKRRRILGFAVAAALHLGLVLAWFLTPPLRLKSNPAPERWVPVLSIATEAAGQPMERSPVLPPLPQSREVLPSHSAPPAPAVPHAQAMPPTNATPR